jgi:hypothetical protein
MQRENVKNQRWREGVEENFQTSAANTKFQQQSQRIIKEGEEQGREGLP